MIDNNGYIVISENSNDTGRFFGKVNGGVMDAMVENGTFQRIVVYDWQALCSETQEVTNDGHLLITPFRVIATAAKFLVGKLLWTLAKVNPYIGVWAEQYDQNEYSSVDDEDLKMSTPKPKQGPKTLRKGQNQEEEDYFNRNQTPIYEENYYACDKQYDLYDVSEDNLERNGQLDRQSTNCST